MRPRAEVDAGAAVPLFWMGRRARAELAEAVSAFVASVNAAARTLSARPRGLAGLDRSVSLLFEVIFVRQKGGGPALLNWLEQLARRLEVAEAELAELRRRLDAEADHPDHPAPLISVRGGGR